jgi:hypothetical protein
MGQLKITNKNGKQLIIDSGSILADKKLEPTDFKYIRDTIKDIGSISEPQDGDVLYIKGYHEVGDGGQGIFIYKANEPRDNHNGGTIIDPTKVFPTTWDDATQQDSWFNTTNTGYGCWVRQYYDAVNVKWFGAIGDGETDDTKAIQSAINNCSIVFLPKATYYTTSTIILSTYKSKLIGNYSEIKSSAAVIIDINSNKNTDKVMYIDVDSLRLISVNQDNILYGLRVNWGHYINITNCDFVNIYNDLNTAVGVEINAESSTGTEWNMFIKISDCNFQRVDTGISILSGTNNCYFENNRIDGVSIDTSVGIDILGGYQNTFINNDIELCNIGINNQAGRQIFIGNLTEQNNTDVVTHSNSSGIATFIGQDTVSLNSTSLINNVGPNGTLNNIFLNGATKNINIDPFYRTQLYNKANIVGGTVSIDNGLTIYSNTQYVVTAHEILLDDIVSGWYTFTIKAKATNGGGLFIKLPNESNIEDTRFCNKKTNSEYLVELFEVNSMQQVIGKSRSPFLQTDYRIYSGSIKVTGTLTQRSIELAFTGLNTTIDVEYISVNKGLIGTLPTDKRDITFITDVSGLADDGGIYIIEHLNYTTGIITKISSFIDDFSCRIADSLLKIANGSGQGLWYETGTNTFGSATDTTNKNELYLNTQTGLLFYNRTGATLDSNLKLITTIEVIS